jgi:hypothetical protein
MPRLPAYRRNKREKSNTKSTEERTTSSIDKSRNDKSKA